MVAEAAMEVVSATEEVEVAVAVTAEEVVARYKGVEAFPEDMEGYNLKQ